MITNFELLQKALMRAADMRSRDREMRAARTADTRVATIVRYTTVDDAGQPDPLESHPPRVKGGGGGGIVPALAMNAIIDALSAYGIEYLEMPATPARERAAIREAQGEEKGS
jgi:hypothetical protein